MFTRIVIFDGATDIDGGIDFIRDSATPVLREQNGYRGVVASANRGTGVVGALSLWEAAADREASDGALAKVREEGLGIIGGTLSVETYEQTLSEIAAPPVVGSSLLIRRISMDPSLVEDNFAFFEREVLPQIRATEGFLAIRHMIDRASGNGLVGTVWTNETTLKAAAEAAEERRKIAAGQRVTFGEQTTRTIEYVDLV